MKVLPYLKAVAAAVVTGLGSLQVAYLDNVVTREEWIGVAVATVVALGGVWAVPNQQKGQQP
jgi:hypothetical protein